MADRLTPIYSAREDDLDLRDAIDDFVVHLAERVDLLQDAEASQDLGQLRALAELLSEDARELGFEPLAHQAGEIVRCCEEDKADAAHEAIVGATEVARRIRLGHRGAL